MNNIAELISLIKEAGALAQWYIGTAITPMKYKNKLKFPTLDGKKLILENKIFLGQYLYEKLLNNLTKKNATMTKKTIISVLKNKFFCNVNNKKKYKFEIFRYENFFVPQPLIYQHQQ